MNVIGKVIRRLGFHISTIIVKLMHSKLSVNGLFRGRRDTQIILEEAGTMKLGRNVSFQRNVSLTSVGGSMDIGSYVSFNRNCIAICRKEITIKDHVIFGPGVTIYDHDHKFSDKGILPGFNHGSVIIEEGCWIGANVTILRNTHIGEGCVVGAGTIVQGDIPPNSLVTSDRALNIVPIRRNKCKPSW